MHASIVGYHLRRVSLQFRRRPQVVRRRPRAARRQLRRRRGRGARARRRERRRQVDAAEDPRRARRGPTPARSAGDGERLAPREPARRASSAASAWSTRRCCASRTSASRPTSSPAARSAAAAGCDEAAMRARTRALLDGCTCAIDPDAPAESLSAAHRQLLQVARALAFECRILVLDEPTTSLTDAEADHLFDVLRELQGARHDAPLRVAPAAGSVPAVRSHHRAARRRATSARSTATTSRRTTSCARWSAAICRRAIGRRRRRAADAAAARSTIDGLSRAPCFRRRLADVARRRDRRPVRPGRLGRSELLETIFGLHRADAGDDRASTAQPVALRLAARRRARRHRARAGRAPAPGPVLQPRRSATTSCCRAAHVAGRRADRRERASAATRERLLGDWRIKAAGVDALPDTPERRQPAEGRASRSGWRPTPRVLLLDEPTKGVDVGAKFEIHEIDPRSRPRAGSPCSSSRATCRKCSRSPIASS